MCGYINSFDTNTKFVILMHPKEFKKVKNNTGYFTHRTLNNSELFIGVDFSNNSKINEIISTHDSYILFPSENAIELNTKNPKEITKTSKNIAIFLIDSTWGCVNKMFKQSTNLQKLKHMSFNTSRVSEYKIKVQPQSNYLSTMESTLVVLELLNFWKIESSNEEDLEGFLNPFHQMIEYQKKLIEDPLAKKAVRFRKKSTS